MNILETPLPGVLVLEPNVFGDEGGFFFEGFIQRAFDGAVGQHIEFARDNHSRSARGVLRGLHDQVAPHLHGKLVRVVKGSDGAVDDRRASPTFGRWACLALDATTHRRTAVLDPRRLRARLPRALEDDTHFLYRMTGYCAKDCERTIARNDTAIGIAWPGLGPPPLLAVKDAQAAPLSAADLL